MASVVDWLDSIKAGYGSKFGSVFDDDGLDDTDDVGEVDVKTMADLEAGLVAAGAKPNHIRKIKTAMTALTSTNLTDAHGPGAPTPSSSPQCCTLRKGQHDGVVNPVSRMKLGEALCDSQAPSYSISTSRQSLFDSSMIKSSSLRFKSGQAIATVVAGALPGSDAATQLECTKVLLGEDIRTAGDFVSLDWEDFNTLPLSANQRSKLRKVKAACEMEQASRKRALTRASSSVKRVTRQNVTGFWDQFSCLRLSGLLPAVKVNGEKQSDTYCRWVRVMDFVIYINAPIVAVTWSLMVYYDRNVLKSYFHGGKLLAMYSAAAFLYGTLNSAWLRVIAKDALCPSGALWMSAEALGIDNTFMAAAFQTKMKSPLKTLNSAVLMFSVGWAILAFVVNIILYIKVYDEISAFPKCWFVVIFFWQFPLSVLWQMEWCCDIMVMIQYSYLSTACLGEFETRAAIVLEEATSSCTSSAGQMAHAHMLEELEEKYLKPCFATRSTTWGKSALLNLICASLCVATITYVLTDDENEDVPLAAMADTILDLWFWLKLASTVAYTVGIQYLICRISDSGIRVLTKFQAPRASVGSALIFGDATKYTQYLDNAGLLVAKVGSFTYCSNNVFGTLATFVVALLVTAVSSQVVSFLNAILDVSVASTSKLLPLSNATNATMVTT
jgi:hypothetical protein